MNEKKKDLVFVAVVACLVVGTVLVTLFTPHPDLVPENKVITVWMKFSNSETQNCTVLYTIYHINGTKASGLVNLSGNQVMWAQIQFNATTEAEVEIHALCAWNNSQLPYHPQIDVRINAMLEPIDPDGVHITVYREFILDK